MEEEDLFDPDLQTEFDDMLDPLVTEDFGRPEFSLSRELQTEAAVRRANASRDTRSGNWQMDAVAPGEYIEGVAAIEQSMWIILNTVPGSQPLSPEFGSNIWQYLDNDMPVVAPPSAASIKRDLNRWEPRITVTRVTYSYQNSFGTTTGTLSGIRFNVFWFVNSDASNEQVSDLFFVTDGNGVSDVGIFFILATDDGLFILTDANETIPVI